MTGSHDPNEELARAFCNETKIAVEQEFRRIVHSLDQMSEEDLWRRIGTGVNSAGNLLLHLCGNLRQWFIHGVGGAEDVRDRPSEFAECSPIPKQELIDRLGALVSQIGVILDGLDARALLEPRRIQGNDTRVLEAIYSTTTHLEGHSLQISMLAHVFAGERYVPFWKPSTPEQGAF